MVAEMLMKVVAKTQSMKFRVSKGPFCEGVLQILDMTPPKLRFGRKPDEFMLQITMETCPREIGIRRTGHPSSYKSFISVTDNEVPSQSRK